MKKILICCLMALGAFATQSFTVSNHVDMKPLVPNVPFNMYTEGELPNPWGFPGHEDHEALLTIINNTDCKIDVSQWMAGIAASGLNLGEFYIKRSVMPGTSEIITYEDVKRMHFGITVLQITNSVARFHVDGWPESIDHGVTRIWYNGPGDCTCVLVTFDAINHILKFDPC